MKNREVFGLQGASQNVGLQNIQEVLFIDKTNVLTGHMGALEHRPMFAQSQLLRLSARNHSKIPQCSR
jgi:hypothetical protein